MTAITTIRIDHAALPEQSDRSRPNAVAEAIEPALPYCQVVYASL